MSTKVEKLKKNIPELRFPGFEGEPSSAKATEGSWEEKRLGDVGRFVSGTGQVRAGCAWAGSLLSREGGGDRRTLRLMSDFYSIPRKADWNFGGTWCVSLILR